MPTSACRNLFPAWPAVALRRRDFAAWAITLICVVSFHALEARAEASAERVVSLAPSLTAILVTLGAGDLLVGIDEVSARQQPALAQRVRVVGGLFNPSLEGVVALEPDLVVFVPSAEQRNFQQRLSAVGIATEAFSNLRFEDVLENIERLGRLAGREPAARERIDAIRAVRAQLEASNRAVETPRVVMVLQRDPLFVVGGGSFIDEMIAIAGARNLAAELGDAYPRASIEWLVAAAPEVLIDMDASHEPAPAYWGRWPALGARGRIVHLDPSLVTLPGPHLDRAMQRLAAALHPKAPFERGAPPAGAR